MEYDKLKLIEQKADKLLNDLREGDDASLYANALYVLVALLLLSMAAYFIRTGEYRNLLIYSVILVSLLFLYKVKMSAAYKENHLLSAYKKNEDSDKTSYVSGLLKYLSSGLDIKIKRLESVRIIYVLIFPLLLMILKEFFHGKLTGASYMWHLVFAFFMGGLFWFIYFKEDLTELKFRKEDVDDMVRKLYSS